jgi:hypothetical protein
VQVSRLSLVVDGSDDAEDVVAANDEILESAFPKRRGAVDEVSWQETEEIGYRLYFGRLSRRWGIASWGLVTLRRGAVVAQVTYDDRPKSFTRDGLITWLVDSGVNVYEAPQLADLAVAARGDLFPGEQSGGDDAMSAAVAWWSARSESPDDETA